ncbi:MAG: response regulator [Pseudomonadota bacterium]
MPSSPPRKRVLIADDEPEMRIFLSRLLETGGYEPIIACSVEECLSLALRENPDVILLEAMMNEQQGLRLFAELRNNPELSGIPVVLMSNIDKKTFCQYRKLAGAGGAARPEGYFAKPPEAEELCALLHELTEPGRGGEPWPQE